MSNEAQAGDDVYAIDDISRRKFNESAGPATARIQAGLRDLVETASGAADIFNRMLVDAGVPDPLVPEVSTIAQVIGQVCGRVIAASEDDRGLGKRRVLALLDAATDRHRTSIEGQGYLFRFDPAFVERVWPGGDRGVIDQLGRLLRAMAMELCDLIKDDRIALACARTMVAFTCDLIGGLL